MTKSLSSNIVKWNYINFEKEDKFVINSDKRIDLLAEVLSLPKSTAQAVVGAVSREETASFQGFTGLSLETVNQEELANSLVPSLQTTMQAEELEALRQELLKEAEETLESAKEEARNILENAKKEAEEIKQLSYEVGKEDGFQTGMKDSQTKVIAMEMEYNEKVALLEQEYNQKLEEAEPQFVNIMINLIEKITGIMVENKKEVILHLVHNGIRHIGKSKKYIIQCSTEDYSLLEGEKERLCMTVGLSDGIEIVENLDFTKNQCIIEADAKIIDCSLDIQLRNLIETLKILNIS